MTLGLLRRSPTPRAQHGTVHVCSGGIHICFAPSISTTNALFMFHLRERRQGLGGPIAAPLGQGCDWRAQYIANDGWSIDSLVSLRRRQSGLPIGARL